MSLFNSSQLWDYDDFASHARHWLLDGAIPAGLAGISVLSVVFKMANTHGNEKSVQLPITPEDEPLINANGAINDYGTSEKPQLTLSQRHFDISRMKPQKDDGSPHGILQSVLPSFADRTRLVFEMLLLVLQLAISVCTIVVSSLSSEWSDAPFVPYLRLFFSLYVAALAVVRMMKLQMPDLWAHSATIYGLNLFPAAFTFRSALINKSMASVHAWYYIVEFSIALLLVVTTYTARVGDRPSQVYVTDSEIKPSPESVSTLFSIMFYSWVDPMIWKSYWTPIVKTDIWGLRHDDYAFYVLRSFEAMKTRARFTIKMISYFKYYLAAQSFWALLDAILIFSPSVLLKRILEYVSEPATTPATLAWLFVFLMLFLRLLDSMASGRSLFLGRRVCIRMKALIIAQVYAKALRRRITAPENKGVTKEEQKETVDSEASPDEASQKPSELGAIINLMAVDAFKVSEICGYLHYFVGAILMATIAIALLYGLLGWSALVGSASIVLLMPVNYKLAMKLGDLQKDMLAITDQRIQKLNEAFQSIRIIKFFAWEEKFAQGIMNTRNKELALLKWRSIVWVFAAFMWFITPTLVTFLSFYCYTIVAGNTLTTPVAFTALSLFNLLRTPLDQLSDMTSFVIQSKVSLDRVEAFLSEEETDKYEQLSQPRGPTSPKMGFDDATFSWNKLSESDFKLRGLNIEFKEGKLNAIFGPTGSGKTSLLLALLGEMQLLEGAVFLPGTEPRDELLPDPATGLTDSVAYCSQSAWLLNDTVKNNIVFAGEFHEERYQAVIEACGLKRDLEQLEAGDATEIGEKGITLSGGQKQRVSLARALYSPAKHVLLDDCLSAVDSHTALWIYENCIAGKLMENRTCILVSHNVALTIQKADWIVLMENGKVKCQGTPDSLMGSGELGDDHIIKTSVLNSRAASVTNIKSLTDKNAALEQGASKIDAKLKEVTDAAEAEAVEGTKADAPVNKGKLVEEETQATGTVDWGVYSWYSHVFGGVFVWLLLVFMMFGSQLVYMGQSVWLRKWSLAAEDSVVSVLSSPMVSAGWGSFKATLSRVDWTAPIGGEKFRVFSSGHSTLFYISVYTLIGVGYSFVACLRVLITFLASVKASGTIFEALLDKALHAKIRFFDATPIGRIMNRFSKDIESVDQELGPYAEAFVMTVIQCFATIGLICFVTPGFIVLAVIIGLLYYIVGMLYLSTSRELKRFDSVTRSPIHQHFTETLVGVTTIRAYGDERRFMRQNLEKIDDNNAPFFYMWVANRWLSFRVDLVGTFVSFFAGAFVLLNVNVLDAGLAGLSLSYAIAFTDSALWVVRLYATVEMNMNSVERLKEYLEIEQEPPAEVPETKPLASWPERGEIEVSNVSLRYAPELPRVINNVSFKVESNHKVGIVGRTGAGKSTIITAFFRFLDPEEGFIKIDDVDITSIGLKDLRSAITIIPQDPTLFTGTIRSNLDPFEQYADDEIFRALTRVNLIGSEETAESPAQTENANKFLNLDNEVTEGGSNLSQGQRQLMCLARSLLKSPKVILLDEATASIDYASDQKIQHTIRDEFAGSTILTIAHRLRSIIDYDKILVMNAGRVVEYDDPYTLIADKSSLFHDMCDNSGELDVLTQAAKESYVKRRNV